jgi:glycosyltransferase involved in cell wall biosynthesis
MRIGIDARFYGSIGKGLGRYTQKLIENLEKTDQENLYFIFLRKDNFDEYQPKNKNFKKVLADYRWYTLAEQIRMPSLLNKYNLDLVHFPHFNVPLFYRKKFIVTIHDLILIHFPTIKGTTLNPLFYKLKFWMYKLAINSAIKRSEKIIAVSNFTKEDILSNYKVNSDKISVAYEACDDFCNFSIQKSRDILEKYGIIKPYILYVGNAYPHKNLEELVLAFSQIKEEIKNLRLVLVGKEDYFYTRLKKIIQARKIEKVIFSGFVPDKDLDTIYREAELYVFPSLYEGFGLPPLEAMAKGVPVISSDHPCMREILEDSAFYFNAKNRDEMAEKIKNLIRNTEEIKKLREKGYQQSKKYSWNKMAGETLKIYKEI